MDRRNRYPTLVLWAVVAIASTEYAMDVVWKAQHQGWGDFRAYYTAAIASERGEDYYDYDRMGIIWKDLRGDDMDMPEYPQHYVYPPLFVDIVKPITRFSLRTAACLWLLANAAAWPLVAVFLLRVLKIPPSSPATPFIICLALRFEPALAVLDCGQVTIILFLMLLLSLQCYSRGRSIQAAAWLSASVFLKPTYAILPAYFLIRGPRRMAIWTGVFVLLWLVIPGCVTGFEPTIRYLTKAIPRLSKGTAIDNNQSLNGWALRLGDTLAGPGIHREAFQWFAALLAGGLVLYTLWRCRGPATAFARDIELCMVIVLSTIISPLTWIHHMTWLLFPIAWLYRYDEICGLDPLEKVVLLASVVAVGVVCPYFRYTYFLQGKLVLVSSLKLYGALLMYFLLLRIRGKAQVIQSWAGDP
jgi:alpha-1,2-mannosyltransferase